MPPDLSTYSVKKGNKVLIIPAASVSYFVVENQLTYLMTFEGDKFILDCSLGQVEKTMNNTLFFRVNRQMIVSKKAINGYEKAANDKIIIKYSLLNTDNLPNNVSRYKAPAFRSWIIN